MTYLLFHLAEDDLEKSKVTKTKPRPYIKTKRNIQEEFDYFQSIDFWIIADLEEYVKSYLYDFREFFADSYLFANDKGRKKLQDDYPQIWEAIETNLNT